jgi:hypothetical protein
MSVEFIQHNNEGTPNMDTIETVPDYLFDRHHDHNGDISSLSENLLEYDDSNLYHDNPFHDALVKLDAELTNLCDVEPKIDEEGYHDALDVWMDKVLALTHKIMGEE